MSQLKIVLDTSACVSNGACLYAAPDIFDQDDNHKVIVGADIVEDSEMVREAANNCPAGAIRLFNSVSNEEIL